ncbi:MAG: SDR family NAD(P)-dependent oxidoreductase [Candidatus Nanopelagicaceae bacterium]
MKRVAVVTGSAGGMGRAITKALIRDGFFVVGLDLKQQSEKFDANLYAHFTLDLTKPHEIDSVFQEIESKFGGVDALVNNAGSCFMSDFPDIPAEEFELQMAVNFSSAFHCSQAAVKSMLRRDGFKKIVNISSNGAYNFDVFDPPHYRASKAAMDTLTKDLARRYAKERICCNSIAPAMTETPLFDLLTEETLNKAISNMPQGKPMQPSQIADWVAFLISPAGDVVSGNVIIINQGRDVR